MESIHIFLLQCSYYLLTCWFNNTVTNYKSVIKVGSKMKKKTPIKTLRKLRH